MPLPDYGSGEFNIQCAYPDGFSPLFILIPSENLILWILLTLMSTLLLLI